MKIENAPQGHPILVTLEPAEIFIKMSVGTKFTTLSFTSIGDDDATIVVTVPGVPAIISNAGKSLWPDFFEDLRGEPLSIIQKIKAYFLEERQSI